MILPSGSAGQQDDGQQDHLDELRRRLYRAGATDRDRQRYAAAREAAIDRDTGARSALDPPSDAPPEAAPRPSPDALAEVVGAVDASSQRAPADRIRRVAAPAAILGAVLALALLAAVLARPATLAPLPAAAAIPVPPATSRAFLRALGRDRDAGLSGFFYDHPQAIPAALRTTTRADTQEQHGRGAATVPIDPSSLAFHGGHVTLVLVTDANGPVRWRLTRVDVRPDFTSYPRTVAHLAVIQRAGAPVPTTARYTGAPPTRVLLRVPPGVRWGLLVVLSD